VLAQALRAAIAALARFFPTANVVLARQLLAAEDALGRPASGGSGGPERDLARVESHLAALHGMGNSAPLERARAAVAAERALRDATDVKEIDALLEDCGCCPAAPAAPAAPAGPCRPLPPPYRRLFPILLRATGTRAGATARWRADARGALRSWLAGSAAVEEKRRLLAAERQLARWVPPALTRSIAGKLDAALGLRGAAPAAVHDRLEALYDAVDTDRSGLLDRDEVPPVRDLRTVLTP
jgi:hypothetical protein